jgi:single-stranded-DNA-specific exonuclease
MNILSTPANDEILLGVVKSITDRSWKLRSAEFRIIQALAQDYGLTEIIARVIAGRGVTLETAHHFLNPSLKENLPNPSDFQDMDKAASRIVDAIEKGEKIAIFGDYDVDGATSTALFKRFFRHLNIDVMIYIPDRMIEGYGPNIPALLKLKEQGASLVITVDCGQTSFEPLAAAAEAGLDVIVVDHHQASLEQPAAVAVINPNRLDHVKGYGQLAAIGVSFIVAVALNRELRARGYFEKHNFKPLNLLNFLDLVALGTICDVVPLTGINRALVTQGLKVMASRANLGVKALAEVANVNDKLSTYHAGFILGPRVNAGGRVGRVMAGTTLLTTENISEAQEIAKELHIYNEERKAIENIVLEQAMQQVQQIIGVSGIAPPVIVASGANWHAGVIGIVAGRLKEYFSRPTFVIGIDDDGEAKGSGRSIPGVDLGAAVAAARDAGILLGGGGHAMAAGLSLLGDKLGDFKDFMIEKLEADVSEAIKSLSLKLDGALSLSAVTVELTEKLEEVGPYGQGNAKPRFAFADVKVVYADVVGGSHVKCTVESGDGTRIKAMCFRSADQPLGQLILSSRGKKIHLAGTLTINDWNGRRSAEIFIDDAAVF